MKIFEFWQFFLCPNHSRKFHENLRDDGRFLVVLTWNDPVLYQSQTGIFVDSKKQQSHNAQY